MDILDEQAFADMMYDYRHAGRSNHLDPAFAFEVVKDWIREHAAEIALATHR